MKKRMKTIRKGVLIFRRYKQALLRKKRIRLLFIKIKNRLIRKRKLLFVIRKKVKAEQVTLKIRKRIIENFRLIKAVNESILQLNRQNLIGPVLGVKKQYANIDSMPKMEINSRKKLKKKLKKRVIPLVFNEIDKSDLYTIRRVKHKKRKRRNKNRKKNWNYDHRLRDRKRKMVSFSGSRTKKKFKKR
jgi:hypothetical protein